MHNDMTKGDGCKLHHGNLQLDIWRFFSPQVWSNTGTGTQIRLDLTELPALHGPILSGRSNHMTSRAPFEPKLFYDPVILRVTYTEAMASIFFFFFYSNVT